MGGAGSHLMVLDDFRSPVPHLRRVYSAATTATPHLKKAFQRGTPVYPRISPYTPVYHIYIYHIYMYHVYDIYIYIYIIEAPIRG